MSSFQSFNEQVVLKFNLNELSYRQSH